MKLKGAYRNSKTGEVRVVFTLRLGYFAVVKLFRTDDELHSVKFWHGDVDKTMSHWNTKELINDPKINEEGRKRLVHMIKLMSDMARIK